MAAKKAVERCAYAGYCVTVEIFEFAACRHLSPPLRRHVSPPEVGAFESEVSYIPNGSGDERKPSSSGDDGSGGYGATLPAFIDARKRKPAWFHINYKLVPLKVLMLLMYGGIAALYPYLSVHMKSVGLSLTESAIIYGILPFFSCLGPLLGGFLADKIGNYKLVLIGFNLFSILVHLLLCFAVPSAVSRIHMTDFQHVRFNLTLPCAAAPGRLPAPLDRPLLSDLSVMDQDCLPNTTSWPGPDALESQIQLRECRAYGRCGNASSLCVDATTSGWRHCLPLADSSTGDTSGPRLTNAFIQRIARTNDWWIQQFSLNGQSSTRLGCRAADHPDCEVRCAAVVGLLGSCRVLTPPANHTLVFVLYFALRMLAGMVGSTLMPLMDAAAYQMSEEHGGDLGFQRMFSLIGVAIFPPLSGYLVGVASQYTGSPNYAPSFITFGAMHSAALVISCFMTLSLRNAAENIVSNMGQMLRNPKVFVFVVMMFLAGCAWGFLENYLFWFMEDLQSPTWVLGMTNTVASVAALPVVAGSTWIMRHMGHTKVFIGCFLLYGCRFFAYSSTYNPFLILPVEILEAFTTSLLWVVASVYCGKIAPDYLATLQGVIGSVHYAMGRGVGGLAGGVMFEKLQPRLTYIIWGSGCMVVGLIYAVLHYAWLKRVPNPQRTDADGMRRPSQLSPEDEKMLQRFAKMDAFTRRYTAANILAESEESPSAAGRDSPRRGSDVSETESLQKVRAAAAGRRKSTLVPTVAGMRSARR
ncbi:major facilitator superfamily domain-containing protein 6-like [Paramacrobiotus metropolitanus]|uniref:major facilitator superfamily domain-containing protein 6-like n=1 Tax=Paramacrobiotus metropolitanus TaxID=2943436 RepID=UPI0024457629|nr:major facilitator superfamily domain-containing protein 6-like [Paramacrobiotus metropolitanus]